MALSAENSSERVEQLLQETWVLAVAGHPIQLGLELIGGDRSLPELLERDRFREGAPYLLTDHVVGHD